MDTETHSKFEIARQAQEREVELTHKYCEVEAQLLGARKYVTKLSDIHIEMVDQLSQAKMDAQNKWIEYYKEVHNYDYIHIPETLDDAKGPVEENNE